MTDSRELYADEFADTDPSTLALIEAVRAGRLVAEAITPEQETSLIADLDRAAVDTPEDVDDTLVVTTLRLPLGVHNAIKDYAIAHGTKPGPLMRGWIEDAIRRESAGGDIAADLREILSRAQHALRQQEAA